MMKIRLGLVMTVAFSFASAMELTPLPSIGVPTSQGTASWYGRAHEGRKTASGAVFRRGELTAAHRTAQFGTHLLVFYKNQVVEVLINDRGPYTRRRGRYSRDLDLSEAAARSLGLTEVGVAKVSLRVVEYPPAQEVDPAQLLPLSLGSLVSSD